MTLKRKIEKWLELALTEVATDQKLRIYTGETANEELKRPAIIIAVNRVEPAEGMQWEDGERTITAAVSVELNTASKPDTIDAAWEAVEDALANVRIVSDFSGQVSGLVVHRYSVESIGYDEPEERHTSQTHTLSIMAFNLNT